jgi:NAD(P)-dependent dehydrogenase (short-subunit alcohol dehydrogenase family)
MPNTVLITGANRGIGACLAKQYLARGDKVIAGKLATTYLHQAVRNASDPSLADKGFLQILPLDMESDASIATLATSLSETPIDILLLNAGILNRDTIESPDLAKNFAQSFRVNTTAPILVSQGLKENVMLGTAKKVVLMTSRMGSMGDNGKPDFIYTYRKWRLLLLSRE